MKNTVVRWCLFGSIAALTACGGGADEGNGSTQGAPAAAQASASAVLTSGMSNNSTERVTVEMLQGLWTASCYADTDGTSFGGDAKYTGNDFMVSTTLFGSSNCTLPFARVSLSGNFSLGNTLYTSAGSAVTELDALGSSLLFQPVSAEFANYINADNFCGRSNWGVGEAQGVNECLGTDGNLNNFDIVEFNGDAHFLGDNTESLDGSSAAKRPTSIDYSIRYSQIQNDDTAQENTISSDDSRVTPSEILATYLLKVQSLRP